MDRVRADGVKRRDAILDAALECFARRGVLGTGIEHIRKAAGASPSSLYHHFGGLDGVVLAMLERTFARLFGHLAQAVIPTRSARAAVLALVDAHLAWVIANRDEARVMYQIMAIELPPPIATALARKKADLLGPVAAHFGGFIAAGTLPAWEPLLFDVVMLGTAHEACRRYLAGGPIDPVWMREALPRLAWAALRQAR